MARKSIPRSTVLEIFEASKRGSVQASCEKYGVSRAAYYKVLRAMGLSRPEGSKREKPDRRPRKEHVLTDATKARILAESGFSPHSGPKQIAAKLREQGFEVSESSVSKFLRSIKMEKAQDREVGQLLEAFPEPESRNDIFKTALRKTTPKDRGALDKKGRAILKKSLDYRIRSSLDSVLKTIHLQGSVEDQVRVMEKILHEIRKLPPEEQFKAGLALGSILKNLRSIQPIDPVEGLKGPPLSGDKGKGE